MKLHNIYKPITATPFACSDSYMEFEPCDELKPYIRCFWGTKKPITQIKSDIPSQSLIIPDTCMDIIFRVNFTENRIDSMFCGIDDRSFSTYDKNDKEMELSTFAIRFYAWSVILFAEESMKDVRNTFFEAGYHFSKLRKEIEPLLFDVVNMEDRIAAAEQYLWKSLHLKRNNHTVMEAMAEILQRKGKLKIDQLAKDIHTSNRQLERMFKENIGISPKKLSSLVRYQYLWKDVLFQKEFNVLNAVHELGYADQAHLLNDFRRFHTMSVRDAKKYALKQENVGFLQEK